MPPRHANNHHIDEYLAFENDSPGVGPGFLADVGVVAGNFPNIQDAGLIQDDNIAIISRINVGDDEEEEDNETNHEDYNISDDDQDFQIDPPSEVHVSIDESNNANFPSSRLFNYAAARNQSSMDAIDNNDFDKTMDPLSIYRTDQQDDEEWRQQNLILVDKALASIRCSSIVDRKNAPNTDNSMSSRRDDVTTSSIPSQNGGIPKYFSLSPPEESARLRKRTTTCQDEATSLFLHEHIGTNTSVFDQDLSFLDSSWSNEEDDDPDLSVLSKESNGHSNGQEDYHRCSTLGVEEGDEASVNPVSPPPLVSSGNQSFLLDPSTSLRSTTHQSERSIHWTGAFEESFDESCAHLDLSTKCSMQSEDSSVISRSPTNNERNRLHLSFGPNTTIDDLKYFAETGCIVPLLCALDTPRLKTLGTRMIGDYAKMPSRRIAIASNRRILDFCCRTMIEMPYTDEMGSTWPAREYAVETIRSLTATGDSDKYVMAVAGLLKALAIVAAGGPFVRNMSRDIVCDHRKVPEETTVSLVTGKSRLHACIALMNLSCCTTNKVKISSTPEVLQALSDVISSNDEDFSPLSSTTLLLTRQTKTLEEIATEARLKATTCIKNLSNSDETSGLLIRHPGLVRALGRIATETCNVSTGATLCTVNACLAITHLSAAEEYKHIIFKTTGLIDSLMTVLERTCFIINDSTISLDAKIEACTALSSLAMGYENKVPMCGYPGLINLIVQVIERDSGETRIKACSVLWSFAAEMRNQVPIVKEGKIVPTLLAVLEEEEETSTEARLKCVPALALLAESHDNAIPLLDAGALDPVMDILAEAGPDPYRWHDQAASWCVGFLLNLAQSDDAAPFLREAGVIELLTPLLSLDHYQSLKAGMVIAFLCRYDEDDKTSYDLLRKTETIIPKIIGVLHNTLSGKGGNSYTFGVFTLQSSVGSILSLASGPEFIKEIIATDLVFQSLVQVISNFCVNGGRPGTIIGGGYEDATSAILAVRALCLLVEYLIPIPGRSALPFGTELNEKLLVALESFLDQCKNTMKVRQNIRELAMDAHDRIQRSASVVPSQEDSLEECSAGSTFVRRTLENNRILTFLLDGCCIMEVERP